MFNDKNQDIMNKTYLLSLIVAVLAMCGCTKVEVKEMQGRVIATKIVAKTAGEFQLPVTVNNEPHLVWKARSLSEWLHVNDSEWKQNAYNVTVSYDSNESSMYLRNFARVGYVAIDTYDGFVTDTIVVMQRGITPYISMADTTVDASQTECRVTFDSNLIDDCRSGLTIEADVDWVDSIEYLGNGTELLVKFSANAGAERQATITALFTDACRETTKAICVLTQKAFEE